MINIKNISTLIAAIACGANAVALETSIQSSTSASDTEIVSISAEDKLLLKTGDTKT